MFETTDGNVKSFYELLNIIDNKAAALLTFNALLLAGISVWLGYVPLNYLHLLLDWAFLSLLGSCLFLLSIIRLYWSQPTDAATLNGMRVKRTRRYRISWWLSVIAVVIVTGVSVVHTAGTGLKVLGLCESGRCADFFGPKYFGNLDQKS